ncbi:MAG: FAD-binding protein [Clostridiales Family XIII bacterium]|jgi:fumarate reductase flavoprotein subunit|nr:FAD-binding protein [Clostridiales Family XIII bacterium]
MKTINTDVAIIGAGAAGIPAAIEAGQRGVKVDVFEQSGKIGGSCNGGNGVFAVGTRMQKERQFTYTKKQIFDYWMNYTHNYVDAALISEFINRSAGTVDWLESYGVEFSDLVAYYPGAMYVWHFRRDGSPFITDLLKPVSEEAGAVYHLNTSVEHLTLKGGSCTGFTGRDEDGEVRVDAGAVIIASGGTGKRADFVKAQTGWELGKDITVFPGMLYDDPEKAPKLGVELAWEAGAAHTALMIDSFASIPDPNFGPGGVPAQLPWFRQPQNICVNIKGERFISEAEMKNGAFMGNAISIQKDSTAFMIFDQAARDRYEQVGMDYVMGNVHFMDDLNPDEYLKMNWERGNRDIIVADTLEELCEEMGIDRTLVTTVDEYNRAIEAHGSDPVFFKENEYLIPIKGPTYYCAKFRRHTYGVMGGLKINRRAEVVGVDGDTIPGLYAAGNDANSIYGDTYLFALSGNTSSFAINTGRIAGEKASEFISIRNHI